MTTDAPDRLLYLLQVANASFPTGAFNHSYGFETWIDSGALDDAASFESACRDWLRYAAVPTDGAAVAHAHRRAATGDLDGLVDLDRIVGALKLSREAREASFKTGRALLGAYRDISRPIPSLPSPKRPATAAARGKQAVIFGAAAEAQGIGTKDAVLAFLHAALSNLVSVGARLIPLGQIESQRIVREAWPAAHAGHGPGLRSGARHAGQRHRRPRRRQHAARAPAHAALHVVGKREVIGRLHECASRSESASAGRWARARRRCWCRSAAAWAPPFAGRHHQRHLHQGRRGVRHQVRRHRARARGRRRDRRLPPHRDPRGCLDERPRHRGDGGAASDLDIVFVESGGDNLAATFSPRAVDSYIYVIDVAEGDKIPPKGGPASPSRRCWSSTRSTSRRWWVPTWALWSGIRRRCGARGPSSSPTCAPAMALPR